MPRRPRVVLPHTPLHLIQRGNNRQICFVADEDYRIYLDWLQVFARKTGCRLHAYVLMTNHVHLLLSAERSQSPAELMKVLGQRYVQHFNRTYSRTGTLWEGRFRSCLIQAQDYMLACLRYIELNPVRAGMVKHPAEYRWSSYRANAQGEDNALLTPHEAYLALGATEAMRQAAYRELFHSELEPGLVEQIREASNLSCQFEGSQFWIIPGQPHAPLGKARIDIAQYADGPLELLYRGQPLAYRSHMLHEHLQQHKLADDKTVNQRVDGLVKEQRRQARLRAEIEMQEEMRGHGILQPDTHISPPPQGQGRYGLRPAQPSPCA